MAKIGIIGGTGLNDPKLLENYKEIEVSTKYGKPSSKLTTGKIGNNEVVIISRHGKDHSINPTNVNYRANIQALKEQNVTHIIVATACGSLKDEIKPGTFIFIDQFIDHTKQRKLTLHDDKVIHTPMAEPFSKELRSLLSETAKELNFPYKDSGTIVTIEGPRFSTRAESQMFRSWNADVINMTTVPEVILSNEAKIPYASIATVTDFDSYDISRPPVTFEEIMKVINENVDNLKKLFLTTIPKIKQ
jgi:5'-methylthioadenosine phosphorylase